MGGICARAGKILWCHLACRGGRGLSVRGGRVPGTRGLCPVTGAAVGGYRAGAAGCSPPPSANHLSGLCPARFSAPRALCGGMARFYLRVCGLYSQYRAGAGECQGGPPLLLTKPARAAKLKTAAAAACRARRTGGSSRARPPQRRAAVSVSGGTRCRSFRF